MDKQQLLDELSALEKYEGPPKFSCKDLTAAEGYPIVSMKRMDTKFGPAVVAEIVMPGGEAGITFLPQRFVDNLTNTQIEKINKGGYKMRCSGMTGRSTNIQFFV